MTPALPLSLRLFRTYLRSSLPGRTRVAARLASVLPAWQRVPLEVVPGQRVYLDMRDVMARDLLCDYPPPSNIWEPDEQDVMRRIVAPGEIAFDIGSHFGEHSVLLATLVGPSGRIFAFEPNPDRIDALRQTVTQYGNGQVVPVAIADRVGEAVLYVPELHAMASLVDWTNGRVGAIRTHRCQTRTLDSLVQSGEVPQPDFIKCDVEGAELAVFKGATATLDRAEAPMIMYEANAAAARAFGLTIFAATDFLASLSAAAYSFFWVQPGGTLVPIREPASDVFLFNLLAVPRSKRHRVPDRTAAA
jgi:FkbM family methyltransferase